MFSRGNTISGVDPYVCRVGQLLIHSVQQENHTIINNNTRINFFDYNGKPFAHPYIIKRYEIYIFIYNIFYM